ncbi:MAG: DUF4349 domain-containing protein [Actinomycetota bacterium]
MRLREREMPLDPQVERELEAIDRAIAGEPVDPDLEVLAELARALREERVGTEPGFAAELDQRVADGFPRAGRLAGSHRLVELRQKLAGVPPRRILARAGAAATVLVVAGVAISQSGEIGGGGDGGTFSAQPAPDQPTVVTPNQPNAAAEADGDATGLSPGRDALDGRRTARDLHYSGSERLQGLIGPGAVSNFNGSAADVPPAQRKVARRVDLALSTSPERFRTAADGVLDVVRDHRGYVLRSNVSGGDPDAPRSQLGHASFELRIPAAQLSAALGDLSDLGHVVSRTDGRVDITSRFVSAQKRIAALEETRQNLLRQLAEAVTLTEQESIKRRLAIVEAQLSAAEDDLGAAQQRVQLVPVSVSIDADRALADGDDAGGWSLGDAVGDAGKVLSVTAGVLLVSAAVLGPLAILAALIWLGAQAVARLRRERALDQI